MAVNVTLTIFIVIDVIFLLTGCLLLAAAIVFEPNGLTKNISGDAALDLLLQRDPLNVVIANAAIVFFTFIVSVIAIINRNPLWMRLFTWLLLVCGAISLAVGLDIWFSTLKTHANLAKTWVSATDQQRANVQTLFDCCGYWNASSPIPFTQDQTTCPTPAIAQSKGGCANPFSSYANPTLGIVFTALFGIVGWDAISFLAALSVVKDRAEQHRYRLIDAKVGVSGI